MSNNNGIVKISNELINSHTTAALNIKGKVVLVKEGPVWGKKSGYKIPTMCIKVLKGHTLNAEGKKDKKIDPGKMMAVGCSNLKAAHAKSQLPDGFLFTTDETNTYFIMNKEFVISVDDKFNTVLTKVKSDEKPVKEEVVEEEDDF
jgi:hypothetical protein